MSTIERVLYYTVIAILLAIVIKIDYNVDQLREDNQAILRNQLTTINDMATVITTPPVIKISPDPTPSPTIKIHKSRIRHHKVKHHVRSKSAKNVAKQVDKACDAILKDRLEMDELKATATQLKITNLQDQIQLLQLQNTTLQLELRASELKCTKSNYEFKTTLKKKLLQRQNLS